MIALASIRGGAWTFASFSLGVVSVTGDWRWMVAFLASLAVWCTAAHLMSKGWDRI